MIDVAKNNRLKIIVKPNSNKNQILSYDKDILKVAIKAPAEKNKANKEIIKFFSRSTGKRVEIVSGLRSKQKVLRFY